MSRPRLELGLAGLEVEGGGLDGLDGCDDRREGVAVEPRGVPEPRLALERRLLGDGVAAPREGPRLATRPEALEQLHRARLRPKDLEGDLGRSLERGEDPAQGRRAQLRRRRREGGDRREERAQPQATHAS